MSSIDHNDLEVKPETKIIEVEHENQILGRKLIELYEDRIKTLQAENDTLRAQLTQPPKPYNPITIRPVLRTIGQIRQELERRHNKSYEDTVPKPD